MPDKFIGVNLIIVNKGVDKITSSYEKVETRDQKQNSVDIIGTIIKSIFPCNSSGQRDQCHTA